MESVTKKGDMENYLAMKEDPDTAYFKHLRQQERKRLFQEVALRTIVPRTRSDGLEFLDWDNTVVEMITNQILQASETFASEDFAKDGE